MQQSKLSFVTDEVLYHEVEKVLLISQNAVNDAEISLYRNVIDPFSALFDSLRQEIPLTTWLEQEKARQIQKTMQNAVGDFHQAILGNVDGWKDMGVGSVIDLLNEKRKIIAEVKNKHNTTKGNHKKVIYDDIVHSLASHYPGYTGYYVEIIRKSKVPYNKPFVPPDNETGLRRPLNESIRIIDGNSFYSLVTGEKNALFELYNALPYVISDILNINPAAFINDINYKDLFVRAYPEL